MYESRFLSRPELGRLPYFPIAIGHIVAEPRHEVRGTRYPAHTYNFHLVVKGKGWLRMGNETVELRPGTGFLYSGLQTQHYGSDNREPWEVWWVYFRGEGVQGWLGDKTMGDEPWVFGWDTNERLLPLAAGMWETAGRSKTANAPALAAALLQMLLELLLNGHSLHEPGARRLEQRIRRTAEHMRHNCSQPLTLTRLAGHCGVSNAYFSRSFHAVMGVAPLDYLNAQRIELAKQMLLATPRSVKHIAIDCGFRRPGYFIERFRKLEGVTPTAFRERYTEKRD